MKTCKIADAPRVKPSERNQRASLCLLGLHPLRANGRAYLPLPMGYHLTLSLLATLCTAGTYHASRAAICVIVSMAIKP